jgi:putative Flp pilus-assembly TadE/G-like protein
MKNERGQSLVLTLLFLAAAVGMAAITIDVGSWYRADRKLQANADAAALAGAQELPARTVEARTAALGYADSNDGGLKSDNVKFRTTLNPNDTIEVLTDRPAPGFFAQLFGRSVVDVRAKAAARVGPMSSARWAAPVAVDQTHPMLQCGPTCWDDRHPTTLDFLKVGPGAFRLINIDSSRGGTSPATLGDWIENGLNAVMDNNRWYYSDPGMKPNSSHVKSALDVRDETELLFPVYSQTRAQGAGFEYFVVGWAVFHITDYDIHGSKDSRLYGYFRDMVWEGIISETAGAPNFGAKTVSLIE